MTAAAGGPSGPGNRQVSSPAPAEWGGGPAQRWTLRWWDARAREAGHLRQRCALASGINDLDHCIGQTTLARARIVCHFGPASALSKHLGPRLFDTLERHGHRRAQLLGEQRHAQL